MAIKKIWVLIGSFLLGTPLGAAPDAVKAAAPQKIDESTPEDDKAALQAASSEADQWAAKHKSEPVAPKPAADEAAKTTNAAALPGVSAPAATPPADSAPASKPAA